MHGVLGADLNRSESSGVRLAAGGRMSARTQPQHMSSAFPEGGPPLALAPNAAIAASRVSALS